MLTATTNKTLTWDPKLQGLQLEVGRAVAGALDAKDMRDYLEAARLAAGSDGRVTQNGGKLLEKAFDSWSGAKTLHAMRASCGLPDPGFKPRRSPVFDDLKTWDVQTLTIVRALGLKEVPMAGHPRCGMV